MSLVGMLQIQRVILSQNNKLKSDKDIGHMASRHSHVYSIHLQEHIHTQATKIIG